MEVSVQKLATLHFLVNGRLLRLTERVSDVALDFGGLLG